jgi:PERQ amino acid-rich with GYF domain-containing protein
MSTNSILRKQANIITAESVIENLSNFPPDIEIIADTIYAVSTVMDGRRWAEEYIKRRNAASSGIVIEAGTAARSSGGWNEVAKSRPTTASPAPLPETSSSFKVVAGKGKKSGRR